MADETTLVEEFHRLWYSKGQILMDGEKVKDHLDAKYCGFIVQKNPLDLWVYQEIIWECQPDLIVEMGTATGSSALFMANIMDLVGHGQILSVDIDNRLDIVPQHPRIFYIVGDSVSDEVYDCVSNLVKHGGSMQPDEWCKPFLKVMFVLDDDHSTAHVARELALYSEFVSSGQYLIVEDTNVDWPLGGGDGPGKAVHEFLAEHPEFAADKKREKFLMTWNPGGYLKRK